MQRSKTLGVVRFWLAAIFLSIAVTGCGSLDRSDAVPADQEERANIPGMTGIRYWADSNPAASHRNNVGLEIPNHVSVSS